MFNKNPIVRAIDVGHGNVKFTTADIQDDGCIPCSMFPAIALPAVCDELGSSIFNARDTKVVTVDNVKYETGNDVELLKVDEDDGDHFYESYFKSKPYLALFRGALSHMAVEHIDCMVVGLPVRQMRYGKGFIEDLLTGKHPISDGKTVTITKVIVIAQPLGGFIDHISSQGSFEEVKDKINILLDPGMGTLDWLVAKGMKEIPDQSNSVPFGVHVLLKQIAREISTDLNIVYNNIRDIDKGLRSGSFSLFGKEYDLNQHLPAGIEAISPGIQKLKNKVGDARNAGGFYLVGGGSPYYADLLKNAFPNHNIEIVKDPVYANVRGFHSVGKEFVRRHLDSVA